MPNIGEASVRPHQSDEMIKKNSDYGRIVCHCEKVSLGEIKDSIHSTIPPTNLDGLKRRTRCTNGRCQGFHCHADVANIFHQETTTPIEEFINMENGDAKNS